MEILVVLIPIVGGLLLGFMLGNMLCGYKPWAPFIPFSSWSERVYLRPDKWGLTARHRREGVKEYADNVRLYGSLYRWTGEEQYARKLRYLDEDPARYAPRRAS